MFFLILLVYCVYCLIQYMMFDSYIKDDVYFSKGIKLKNRNKIKLPLINRILYIDLKDMINKLIWYSFLVKMIGGLVLFVFIIIAKSRDDLFRGIIGALAIIWMWVPNLLAESVHAEYYSNYGVHRISRTKYKNMYRKQMRLTPKEHAKKKL